MSWPPRYLPSWSSTSAAARSAPTTEMQRDPSAPMVEVEVPVFAWDCEPLLASAPMHCTEFVPGDPSGCARCGESAETHDRP